MSTFTDDAFMDDLINNKNLSDQSSIQRNEYLSNPENTAKTFGQPSTPLPDDFYDRSNNTIEDDVVANNNNLFANIDKTPSPLIRQILY